MFNSVVKSTARCRGASPAAREIACLPCAALASATARAGRLQVLPHESARTCERVAAGLEPGVPQRPSMDHVWPDLESERHVGLAGRRGKADGVVEQGLGRTDLDQGRWQSSKVRIER